MKTMYAKLIVTIAGFVLSAAGQAAVVAPGSVVNLLGDTAVTAPTTTGVVQNDDLLAFSIPITNFTNVGGNVQNRVVLSDDLGTMVFLPRIRDTFNIATEGFEISAFRLDGYAGWNTDIGFRSDGLGDTGPSNVSRSVDGDTLTFRYDDPMFISGIAPGPQEESLFPYIVTDAQAFELTGSMTIFGYDTANPDELLSVTITDLAVPTVVPLPAPFVLLGSGIVVLMGLASRKSGSLTWRLGTN